MRKAESSRRLSRTRAPSALLRSAQLYPLRKLLQRPLTAGFDTKPMVSLQNKRASTAQEEVVAMKRRIVPDIIDNQELRTLSPDATVREAVKMMAGRKIGAVLITRDGKLAGIFTERDVLTRIVDAGLDPDKTKLEEVMTPDPDTLAPNDRAMDALAQMSSRGYRHLPVVDNNQLVGIVSVRDIYSAVQKELESDLKTRDQLIFDTGYGVG